MAQNNRTGLAAVVGAVAIATAGLAEGAPVATLGELLEARAQLAAQRRDGRDIERLATLWLTLERRGELERVVERGPGYLSVALRHQDVSEHRREARVGRFVATEQDAIDAMGNEAALEAGVALDADPAAQHDAQQWLEALDEPFRTVVGLSLEGYSRREVAELMGVRDSTVRKWMQRLRERIADDELRQA